MLNSALTFVQAHPFKAAALPAALFIIKTALNKEILSVSSKTNREVTVYYNTDDEGIEINQADWLKLDEDKQGQKKEIRAVAFTHVKVQMPSFTFKAINGTFNYLADAKKTSYLMLASLASIAVTWKFYKPA